MVTLYSFLEDDSPVYIGMTTRSLQKRFDHHLSSAKAGTKADKQFEAFLLEHKFYFMSIGQLDDDTHGRVAERLLINGIRPRFNRVFKKVMSTSRPYSLPGWRERQTDRDLLLWDLYIKPFINKEILALLD